MADHGPHAKPLDLHNLCKPAALCRTKEVITVFSLISSTFLIITAARIMIKRARGDKGPPVAKLVDNLVLVLCVLDAIYYVPCFLVLLQSPATPILVLHEWQHGLHLIYPHCRETAMALNVLWHCYIANVLMRWTVHKESVARLVKGMNLWMLALMGSLLLFLMTMIDTLVYRDLGLWGLAWGALVLNGIFFPAASFYMLWALSKTAKALKAGAGEDSFFPGRYVHARRKLVLISLFMAITWFGGSVTDAIVWGYALVNKSMRPSHTMNMHKPPVYVYLVRIITCRLIGLLDACVLAGLFDCLYNRWFQPQALALPYDVKAMEDKAVEMGPLPLPLALDAALPPPPSLRALSLHTAAAAASTASTGAYSGAMSMLGCEEKTRHDDAGEADSLLTPQHSGRKSGCRSGVNSSGSSGNHSLSLSSSSYSSDLPPPPNHFTSSGSSTQGGLDSAGRRSGTTSCGGSEDAILRMQQEAAQSGGLLLEELGVWLATWNMGKLKGRAGGVPSLLTSLAQWVPKPHIAADTPSSAPCTVGWSGTDATPPLRLYVLGLQQAVPPTLAALKTAFLQHLGGAKVWKLFSAETRDTDNSGSSVMAVLVAVRVVDVKNGDVTVLSHLGPQDAPVEGLSGGGRLSEHRFARISLRVHGQTIAFVTTRCQAVPEDGLELSDCSDDDENCCLPPPGPMDTMPRNPSSAQALQWGKSNDREASRGQFGWGGKEALDCPLLHHHTFVLGDLGCRTMARPQEVVHWVGASLAKDHHFAQRQQEQQQRLMTQLQALQQQQHQQQQLDDDALPPPPSAGSLLGPLPAPPAPPTDDGSGDGSRDGSRDGAQHDMVLARLAAGFKGLLLPHSLSSSTGGAAQQAKPPLAPVLPQCLGLTPWKQPLMQPSSSWAWVSEHDSLKQAMRLEGLLWGFREAPIRFPPSHTWRREVRVGNGWGVGEGVETAYVMKPSATSGAARRLLGSSSRRSRASEDDPYSSADEGTSRHYYSRTRRSNNSQPTYTPSYSDRVLVRSMGDKRGLLRLCGPYTLAPSATGSDHRPVCLTASLYRLPTPLAPPPGAPKLLSVYTLELCNFRFDADEWGALDVTGLSLTHPLPTEDPLAFHRKADHLLDSSLFSGQSQMRRPQDDNERPKRGRPPQSRGRVLDSEGFPVPAAPSQGSEGHSSTTASASSGGASYWEGQSSASSNATSPVSSSSLGSGHTGALGQQRRLMEATRHFVWRPPQFFAPDDDLQDPRDGALGGRHFCKSAVCGEEPWANEHVALKLWAPKAHDLQHLQPAHDPAHCLPSAPSSGANGQGSEWLLGSHSCFGRELGQGVFRLPVLALLQSFPSDPAASAPPPPRMGRHMSSESGTSATTASSATSAPPRKPYGAAAAAAAPAPAPALPGAAPLVAVAEVEVPLTLKGRTAGLLTLEVRVTKRLMTQPSGPSTASPTPVSSTADVPSKDLPPPPSPATLHKQRMARIVSEL